MRTHHVDWRLAIISSSASTEKVGDIVALDTLRVQIVYADCLVELAPAQGLGNVWDRLKGALALDVFGIECLEPVRWYQTRCLA